MRQSRIHVNIILSERRQGAFLRARAIIRIKEVYNLIDKIVCDEHVGFTAGQHKKAMLYFAKYMSYVYCALGHK